MKTKTGFTARFVRRMPLIAMATIVRKKDRRISNGKLAFDSNSRTSVNAHASAVNESKGDSSDVSLAARLVLVGFLPRAPEIRWLVTGALLVLRQ